MCGFAKRCRCAAFFPAAPTCLPQRGRWPEGPERGKPIPPPHHRPSAVGRWLAAATTRFPHRTPNTVVLSSREAASPKDPFPKPDSPDANAVLQPALGNGFFDSLRSLRMTGAAGLPKTPQIQNPAEGAPQLFIIHHASPSPYKKKSTPHGVRPPESGTGIDLYFRLQRKLWLPPVFAPVAASCPRHDAFVIGSIPDSPQKQKHP